jgi:dTDP-4-dehydrorhamnose 3,5-epimerase
MSFSKISPKVNRDERGSLFEVLSKEAFPQVSAKHIYISRSSRGVVRGFHQQLRYPQMKLVYCLDGEVADFGLNIDPHSDDFGSVSMANLCGDLGEGVLIGRDYAHAFECLSESCSLLYICDYEYVADDQLGISPLDVSLLSLWHSAQPLLSEKDKKGLSLEEAKNLLINKLKEEL